VKIHDSGMSALKCSGSVNNYLEQIHDLTEAKGCSRVTDIARLLHLSQSTVSNMIRRLASREFLNYERYRGFTLTEEGKQIARRTKVRRTRVTEFLRLSGLSDETTRSEIEPLVHYIKPKTLKIISKLVDFWRLNPVDLESFRRFSRLQSKRR
jgi:Mn-dependent DtxR family transcriptional regulator